MACSTFYVKTLCCRSVLLLFSYACLLILSSWFPLQLHAAPYCVKLFFLCFQPPWDLETANKFIIHYTYGCDYNLKVLRWRCRFFVHFLWFRILECAHHLFALENEKKKMCLTFQDFQGELTYGKIGEWRFDKRSHLQGPPPRNLSLPPPGVPESVVCPKDASSECNFIVNL